MQSSEVTHAEFLMIQLKTIWKIFEKYQYGGGGAPLFDMLQYSYTDQNSAGAEMVPRMGFRDHSNTEVIFTNWYRSANLKICW